MVIGGELRDVVLRNIDCVVYVCEREEREEACGGCHEE